mmetsp:Transcript_8095/g.23933  ORF Transcript_8095/g.23933 Transcript_8095/m.23933 type:complete len:97 (+) Transcript_8095:115-405(+)
MMTIMIMIIMTMMANSEATHAVMHNIDRNRMFVVVVIIVVVVSEEQFTKQCSNGMDGWISIRHSQIGLCGAYRNNGDDDEEKGKENLDASHCVCSF